jgi:putative membrane protein
MDRRLVLAGFAAAAAAPALAQTTQPAPIQTTPTPAPSGAGPGAGAMGEAEKQHVQRTMAGGAASLETSRIGLKKAQDEDVKLFASFEVREQDGIADVLKSVQDPSMLSGTVKPPSSQEATALLDAKGQEMVKKMQQAKAGDDFDKDYVKGQLEGHRDLLKVQQDYLKSGKSLVNVAVAKLASGQIQDHIKILEDLEQALKG